MSDKTKPKPKAETKPKAEAKTEDKAMTAEQKKSAELSAKIEKMNDSEVRRVCRNLGFAHQLMEYTSPVKGAALREGYSSAFSDKQKEQIVEYSAKTLRQAADYASRQRSKQG